MTGQKHSDKHQIAIAAAPWILIAHAYRALAKSHRSTSSFAST
jgi:hypothetical protein